MVALGGSRRRRLVVMVTRRRRRERRWEIGRLEVRGGDGVVVRGGRHTAGVGRTSASARVGAVMVVVVRRGAERRRAARTSRHGTDRGDGTVTSQPVLQQKFNIRSIHCPKHFVQLIQ